MNHIYSCWQQKHLEDWSTFMCFKWLNIILYLLEFFEQSSMFLWIRKKSISEWIFLMFYPSPYLCLIFFHLMCIQLIPLWKLFLFFQEQSLIKEALLQYVSGSIWFIVSSISNILMLFIAQWHQIVFCVHPSMSLLRWVVESVCE